VRDNTGYDDILMKRSCVCVCVCKHVIKLRKSQNNDKNKAGHAHICWGQVIEEVRSNTQINAIILVIF